MDNPSPEWVKACMHWYGYVLTGKYAHWCNDWDDLPIDDTCEEIACCTCFEGDQHRG